SPTRSSSYLERYACVVAVARVVGVGGAVLLLVVGQEGRDSVDGRGEVPIGQEGQQAGDLEDVLHSVAVVRRRVGDREHGEFGAVVAGGLGGGHLHRLLFEHELGLDVTGDGHTGEGDDADERAD